MVQRTLAAMIGALGFAPAASGQVTESPAISLDRISRECIPIDDGYEAPGIERHCTVTGSGSLGRLDGAEFYYATYRRLVAWPELELSIADTSETALNTSPYNNTAVVVFRRVSGGSLLHPTWYEMNDGWIGVSWYEQPRILSTPLGPVLFVPLRFSGTGSLNDDRYLVWREAAWKRLDSTSWHRELTAWLPDGHAVWKGVVLDLERMRAETPVWKEHDGNCCPTGGSIKVELALDEDTLVIERAEYTPIVSP